MIENESNERILIFSINKDDLLITFFNYLTAKLGEEQILVVTRDGHLKINIGAFLFFCKINIQSLNSDFKILSYI